MTDRVSGKVTRNYQFFVILYIMLETEEIVKVKFKGSSRGYWFDYSKVLKNESYMPHNIVTQLSTFVDEENGRGKYAIQFHAVKKNGAIMLNDKQEKTNEFVMNLYNENKRMSSLIEAPKEKEQIETAVQQEITADNSDIQPGEVDDIRIEDLPEM